MSRVGAALALVIGSTAAAAPAEDLAFFESRIRPLLIKHCQSCHSTAAKKSKGGLRLDSREAILKGGDSGPAVDLGSPDASILLKAVRGVEPFPSMPPTGKLPDAEIALLAEWVKRGTPFPEAAKPVTHEEKSTRVGRDFWSFRPLQSVPIPAVKDPANARTSVDAFVLAELDKRGWKPSPPASPQTLIRRLTFDLIGLPPTPEEIEAFVNDASPDAYERLVDRLLASPRYGERWGRFWLDLARYADVTESWTGLKGKAFVYRDWVVRAFNEDLPYDRFVRLQLAADLMPDAAPADIAALGFLGLSPIYWKELQLDKELIRAVVAEEWEERIATFGGTFLGLTVACARCHDHKFDPISTGDYYALAGVLSGVRQIDRPAISGAAAEKVRDALARIKPLQDRLAALPKDRKLSAEMLKTKSAALQADIDAIRKATPFIDEPPAPAVDDAALDVLADGPNRTKLQYTPGKGQDIAVQIRGNPSNPGPIAPRRFLEVLSTDKPRVFRNGSGRLELSQALVSDGSALLARVMVNRIWKHHFGSALVETPGDFGSQGARPTHPELLEHLAQRFVSDGWSIKQLHRTMLLSQTYRQVSTSRAENPAASTDPENRFLWRMNRRRLEVEAWRDAMLCAAGTISTVVGGPPGDLGDVGNTRRTLYGNIKRRELHDVLRLNDFPDPTAFSAARLPTTSPIQQLFVLNSPLLRKQATDLVNRLKREVPQGGPDRVRRAYALLFARAPTEAQLKLAAEFLSDGKPDATAGDAQWIEYALALLGSNEFLFVD